VRAAGEPVNAPRCRVCHVVLPFTRRHVASHTCSVECTEAGRERLREYRKWRATHCQDCKAPVEDPSKYVRCERCRTLRAYVEDVERNPEDPPPAVRRPGLCANCVEDRLVAPAEHNGRTVLLCVACEDPAGALRVFDIPDRGGPAAIRLGDGHAGRDISATFKGHNK
jgi:hypothetical protein